MSRCPLKRQQAAERATALTWALAQIVPLTNADGLLKRVIQVTCLIVSANSFKCFSDVFGVSSRFISKVPAFISINIKSRFHVFHRHILRR